MRKFGKVLKKLREDRGLTVNQLALYSKVSASLISRIENDQRGAPKPETIQKLASALKISNVEMMSYAGYITSSTNRSKVMDTKSKYKYSKKGKEFTDADLHFLLELKKHPQYNQFIKDMSIRSSVKVEKLIKMWKEHIAKDSSID